MIAARHAAISRWRQNNKFDYVFNERKRSSPLTLRRKACLCTLRPRRGKERLHHCPQTFPNSLLKHISGEGDVEDA